MSIENCHGGLVPVEDALLNRPGRTPVEHPRAVVLHLRLLKVKVLGLVVSNPNGSQPVVGAVAHGPRGRAGRRPVERGKDGVRALSQLTGSY